MISLSSDGMDVDEDESLDTVPSLVPVNSQQVRISSFVKHSYWFYPYLFREKDSLIEQYNAAARH